MFNRSLSKSHRWRRDNSYTPLRAGDTLPPTEEVVAGKAAADIKVFIPYTHPSPHQTKVVHHIPGIGTQTRQGRINTRMSGKHLAACVLVCDKLLHGFDDNNPACSDSADSDAVDTGVDADGLWHCISN